MVASGEQGEKKIALHSPFTTGHWPLVGNMGNTPSPWSTSRINLTWPVILITLGIMFLLDEFIPGWGIDKTWPILLVIVGALNLVNATRPPRAPRGPQI